MIEYDRDQKLKKSPPIMDEVKRGKSFSGIYSAKHQFGKKQSHFTGQSFKVMSGVELSNGLKINFPKKSETGSKTPHLKSSLINIWKKGEESEDSLLHSSSPSGLRNIHVRSLVMKPQLDFQRAIYQIEIKPKEPMISDEPEEKTTRKFDEMQALYAGVQLIQATWFQSSLPLIGFVAMVGLQQFLKVENQKNLNVDENDLIKISQDEPEE